MRQARLRSVSRKLRRPQPERDGRGFKSMAATLTLIRGGLYEPVEKPAQPTVADVRLEAVRRLRESGYEWHRVRSLGLGVRMPQEVRDLKLRIGYVVDALLAAPEIPEHFRDDVYWPV